MDRHWWCDYQPKPGDRIEAPCPVCRHAVALHIGCTHCPVCELADTNRLMRTLVDAQRTQRLRRW